MRNDENHAGSVELATGGSEVAIVQSPNCQTVTIDQYGNCSPVTINQSFDGGEL